MSKKAFFLLVCLLVSFLGKAPVYSEKTYLGLNDIQQMKPNGFFSVDVLDGSRWQQAGRLTFDRFFREREMDLSSFLPKDKSIYIRLTQKGGGAAHLDNLSIGGMPPATLKDAGDVLALKKASGKDFDVIDAFNKTLEFSFPQNGHDKILRLTARVEGKRVDDTPFQFPITNLYRPIDERARFYEYSLNSHTGNLLVDDNLREISSKKPFFAEFCRTGSGHPAGFTYGWVSNDDDNLYVRIDFTPDNTMDGYKDYAKVYVKTETALKEFKVSMLESLWGMAHFVYTDKVFYQHKLYNFQIPLKELDLERGDKKQPLHLAFSAYGTAAPTYDYPCIAYDPRKNRYFVVYNKSLDIFGRFIDNNGAPIGSEIVISDHSNYKTFPSVAYDSLNQRFLVAWDDSRNSATTYGDIYGQLVNADGTLYNTASNVNFAICDKEDYQSGPSVAFNSLNQKFLVAWNDSRNSATTSGDIYGQLVNADGTLYNTASNVNFAICDKEDYQSGPSVAFDNVNQRFLVAWGDSRNSATTSVDIYGQLVNADGTLYNTASNVNFAICDSEKSQGRSSVAFDNVNQRFLVSWKDLRNSATISWDIYGQLVNTDGTLYNTASNVNFAICDNDAYREEPSVAFDSLNQKFLVAWMDNRDYATTSSDIYGQLVNADGTLYNTASNVNFPISNAEYDQSRPALAYNSVSPSFLVAFASREPYLSDVSVVLIPMPGKDEGNFYVIPNNKGSAAIIYLD